MLAFKRNEYVQDKQANIYKVVIVDHTPGCSLPYRLEVIKRATDDATYIGDYQSLSFVGDEGWIYASNKTSGYSDEKILTAEDLELAEIPFNPDFYEKVRFFKDEVYQDDKGNEFTVLEDCTFGESSCKVTLSKRVSENVYAGNCLYEDCYGFAYCTVSRKLRLYVDNQDEVFMDELHPIKLNNNKRVIQNTKPEDQAEAKSGMLKCIRGLQNQYNAAENFKARMKQIATKVKVQEILELIEQAANRGEFSISVKNAGEVKKELEVYGLSVYGDIVGWAHND